MLDDPVLVLNQNYEPLNICRVKRAIILILNGKAEILQNNSDQIRSATFSMISPSVVRLAHMVRRPRPQPRLTRHRVFSRDNHTCQYCGKQTRNLTLDHVVPRYRGGEHSWKNVVSACKECNQRKAGRTPSEASMILLKKPCQPSGGNCHLIYPFHTPMEWNDYLMFNKKANDM